MLAIGTRKAMLTVFLASSLSSWPLALASLAMVSASVCLAYSFASCAFFLVKGTQPVAIRVRKTEGGEDNQARTPGVLVRVASEIGRGRVELLGIV